MKIILLTLLFGSLNVLAQEKAAEDPVVATVNGQNITKSTLDQAYKDNYFYVSHEKYTKEKVLYDLINRQLGIEKAYQEKLNDNPTVKGKMEDVLYHELISRDLAGPLTAIEVTDKEVEKYYKDHPEYRTSHILLRIRAEGSDAEKQAAVQTALKFYETLRQHPERFEEMASTYSQTASAVNGGDVGFQPAVQLAHEYYAAIKGRKIGHITKPIRTQFGIHIVKVTGVKEFKDIDQGLYKKIIYDQKRDAIIANYLAKLRQSAKIKINKQYL